ncbi:Proteasome adapter and scaffold protein ECM29 [Euphorbia peplus]|nr:Proteasome adapter and scaffold protein ECM29 [Euphorbia peplus]
MADSSSSTAAETPARSDAETEEVLDRMLTRLALCDDSKLEPLLSKLLPFTLSSLSSHSTAVRNKVLEILSHVNKRVKHQSQIGLPLLELWKLYTEANAAPMVKNFCIVYIEMAFERVDVKDKEHMAPMLVASICKLPHQHQEIILRIAVKVIGECHAGGISEEVAIKYRSLQDCQERELFAEFCLHLMLYQQLSHGGGCPPGLSVAQTIRVAGKDPLKNDVLLIRKLGVLNVIEALELDPEVVYPLYLAASADCQEPVMKRGEELLKKMSTANLDDPKLMKKLFLLFNGTTTVENVAPDFRVTPASVAFKTKLMSIFCRSITAASSFPETLQCIFGCINGTTSKLRQLGMEFTVWVFKHARIDQLNLMGPVILHGILKLLDSYSISDSDIIARETKTFSFQAIGLLANRLPHLFREKIDMAVRLFNSLKVEPQSLRFAIQDATNSLAAAYKGAPTTILMDLETLLLNNSQVEENEVRFCAVRWAISLFDSQHCPSRFICMLSAADSRMDIREMALEGLCLVKDESRSTNKNLNFRYPKPGAMLDYILKQQPKLLDSSEIREQKLVFPSKVYVAMIKFLLKCFESELEQNNSLERSSEFLSSVKTMCLLLEHAMAYEGSVELHSTASEALITIASFLPEVIASHFAPRVSWLRQLLSHVDFNTRESSARIIGIACSDLPIAASSNLLTELVSSISSSNNLRFEAYHGILCAIGYITADCISRTPAVSETLVHNVLKCLTDVVKSETAILASVAMEALGHIGLRQQLPPLVASLGSAAVEILSLLHEKLSKLLSGEDIKAIQKIVISIGHICVKETSPSHLNTALDLIFSLCRSKVEDILFAAGEALSFLWGGVPVSADLILKTNYSSLSMASNFLLGDVNLSFSKYTVDMNSEANEDYHLTAREAITRKLFDTLLYSSRKEERCAGTVWLLSLTMYCGRHSAIQQMLPEIQEAFSHLLGEQNELTQDLASQGMSIVYELGDASMKQNLVDALVSTLTGSGKRKRAVKLVEDSEVFQEGTIGESPSGGKISTYKELCNLANEMGQPDLIYKLMDLANHQAALNSKRGAAFGFSKIAKHAGDALQPHMLLLIPRLVRYQYDPDKNVQDAMGHIWKSLVAEPTKTIDQYLDAIIDDLIIQCGSRLWRSREASCLAIADIIQGRKFEQVGKHLKKIWIAAFRAMDDIKETVRNAGDRLCRAASSLTIRLCDVSLSEISDATKTTEIVLPLLLAEGILSKVESIRKASIGVVMKLAKGAGVALRPHLSDLVCCMLESLSSLEDQGLNYVELHAANVGIKTEKLENLRISIAKGSPMWETLDLCINVVNNESLDALVPRLASLVRSGVGLNTRVGVASFISLLVQKVGAEIKPFASTLLRLLFPAVKEEKSAVAKRAFASACAIVLKYAGSAQAQKLIDDTTALHTGEGNAQISCAILLKSYSSMASDVISGHHAAIFPVIFISRFDHDKHVSGLFEELWEDLASIERVTVQLYLDEIVSLIREGLASSSWSRKKKSAQAISKLSEVLGELLSSHHHVLLEALMQEMPGRLWEGKDAILDAIGALSTACHKAIVSENPVTAKAILDTVSSACMKKSKKFREAAFHNLDQVIKAFEDPDFFQTIFPQLFEMCNSAFANKSGRTPMASDNSKAESDNEDSAAPLEKVLGCAVSCIHVARVADILERKENLLEMIIISLSPWFQWTVKTSAFSLIKEISSRFSNLNDSEVAPLHGSMTSFVQELFHSASPKILECISAVKIAQVHIAASECLLEITMLYGKLVPSVNWMEVGFKEELIHIYEVEKNEKAKSYLKKCIDIFGTSR